MTGRALLIAMFAALLISGCADRTRSRLVTAESRDIGKHYRVTPTMDWNRFYDRMLGVELWTINGPRLEAIRLYHGIRDERGLLHQDRDANLPQYRAGMTSHEIAEMVLDTYSRSGASRVEMKGLRPVPFGDLSGFRFDLSYVSSAGLEYRGVAAGAPTEDDRLLLILFTAAAPHYFPTYVPEVERIVASVETLKE